MDIDESLKLNSPIKNASMPKDFNLNYNGYSLTGSESLSPDNKQVNAKINLKVNKIHFSQEDYIPLKQKLSQLEKLGKLYIVGQN